MFDPKRIDKNREALDTKKCVAGFDSIMNNDSTGLTSCL